MADYIAFLRGINISGKNKVPMVELKVLFEKLGFTDVKTVLNSGNVMFASDSECYEEIYEKIKSALSVGFDFDIPLFLIKRSELEDVLAHAPEWWGNDDKIFYNNVIFIMDGTSAEDVCNAVGEYDEIDRILPYRNVIFWTYVLKDYRKSAWWKKTASTDIKDLITIRTAGTVRKVL